VLNEVHGNYITLTFDSTNCMREARGSRRR
jgi:hypothetical protein